MANDLTLPLARIVAAAAKSLPATGQIARSESCRATGAGAVILADVSGSMADPIEDGRQKIAVLQEALDAVRPDWPQARLVAFSAVAKPCSGQLPKPGGGTALHLALDAAARLSPVRTLVISDGQPDDEAAAFAAATRLGGLIDTLYVGPDSDRAAIRFMATLARRSGGRSMTRDIARNPEALTGAIRALALPDLRGAP